MRLWSAVLLSIALALSLTLPGEVASAAPENPKSQSEGPPENSKRPEQPPGKDDKDSPEGKQATTSTTVAPTTTTTVAPTTTTTTVAGSTTTTTAVKTTTPIDEASVQTTEEAETQATEDNEPAATGIVKPPQDPDQPDQPGSASLRPQVVELSNRGLDIPQAAPVSESGPSEKAQPTPLEGLMVAFATTTETTALYWKVALALGLVMSTLLLIGFSRLGNGQSELRREVMPLQNPVSRLNRS